MLEIAICFFNLLKKELDKIKQIGYICCYKGLNNRKVRGGDEN